MTICKRKLQSHSKAYFLCLHIHGKRYFINNLGFLFILRVCFSTTDNKNQAISLESLFIEMQRKPVYHGLLILTCCLDRNGYTSKARCLFSKEAISVLIPRPFQTTGVYLEVANFHLSGHTFLDKATTTLQVCPFPFRIM